MDGVEVHIDGLRSELRSIRNVLVSILVSITTAAVVVVFTLATKG
jgi:hypothetical protein